MKEKKGLLFIVLAGILWGTTGLFVSFLSSFGLTSMQMVFIRMFVSAAVFSVFLLIFDRKLFRIRLKDIWIFIGTGIVSFFLFCLFYYMTIEATSASIGAVLLYTSPVFVLIFSALLFKEKITAVKVLACLLTVCGVAFISGITGIGSGIPGRALLTGVLSGLCYALYSIFSRFAINRGYNTMTILEYTFLFAFIASVPFSDMGTVIPKLGGSIPGYVVAVMFAVVNAVLPYFFFTAGLKDVEAGKASIFVAVEPVVATIVSTVFLREKLEAGGIAGIIMIIAAVVLLNIDFGKGKKDKKLEK